MNEYTLFNQPREELLQAAKKLGIAGASALTKAQLVHDITVAQTAQEQGTPWVQTPRVDFRTAKKIQTAVIRNPTERPMRLGLKVVDPQGAFAIPAEIEEAVLQGHDTLSVPVRFTLPTEGVSFTTSALYSAGIQVWDREANRIVATVDLSATGVGRVPLQEVSCMVSPQSEVPHKRNSPPTISLSVTPEAAWPGSTIHVEYQVWGATEVREGWSFLGADVLPDGTATDEGGWGTASSPTSRDYYVT